MCNWGIYELKNKICFLIYHLLEIKCCLGLHVCFTNFSLFSVKHISTFQFIPILEIENCHTLKGTPENTHQLFCCCCCCCCCCCFYLSSVFLESMCTYNNNYNYNNNNNNEHISRRLSMWNMLNCAEQVQIQKYKTHAYKTLQNSRCPNNHAETSNWA